MLLLAVDLTDSDDAVPAERREDGVRKQAAVAAMASSPALALGTIPSVATSAGLRHWRR